MTPHPGNRRRGSGVGRMAFAVFALAGVDVPSPT